jgi:hypothetical protein
LKVTALPSKSSISWSGDSKIHSNPNWCITPPPFGKQCTLFKKDAIFACTQMPNCIAVTCPDPAPYLTNRKYKAAICQPRTSHVADEINHGMCLENGGRCENILLKRMTVQEATAKMTMSRPRPPVLLQMLSEVQDGDIVLDYKPGEAWFEGAMKRAELGDGWQLVKFHTPFDHVKIAGQQFIFLRHVRPGAQTRPD